LIDSHSTNLNILITKDFITKTNNNEQLTLKKQKTINFDLRK